MPTTIALPPHPAEVTKLAKEYLNTAEFNREYSFDVKYEDLNIPSLATVENEEVTTPRK